MKTNVSLDEFRALMERANLFRLKNDFQNALTVLDYLIENSPPESNYLLFLLANRTEIYTRTGDWESAINDLQKSISINQDNPEFYIQMGVYITWKHFYTYKFKIDESNEELKKSIYYYKECLKRDPVNITAWLNIAETYLFILDWDNVFCYLGLSKSYLHTKENKLIWSRLTCLSVALTGEPIENTDMVLLIDTTEQYNTEHDYQQIERVLSELERIHFYPERVKIANEVHRLYKERLGAK